MNAKKKKTPPNPPAQNMIDDARRKVAGAAVLISDALAQIELAKARQKMPAKEYLDAMRAINFMARQPCENPQPGDTNCNGAIASGELAEAERCWPCYARAIRNEGTP